LIAHTHNPPSPLDPPLLSRHLGWWCCPGVERWTGTPAFVFGDSLGVIAGFPPSWKSSELYCRMPVEFIFLPFPLALDKVGGTHAGELYFQQPYRERGLEGTPVNLSASWQSFRLLKRRGEKKTKKETKQTIKKIEAPTHTPHTKMRLNFPPA
jgi:hypothetical protein